MGYSVSNTTAFLLSKWLFNEEHTAKRARYKTVTFTQLLMNAAQAKDYVENVSGLDPKLPNVDTLFWRLGECATPDLISQEYKRVVERGIEEVKARIRRRRFIVAIDETYEPFYGKKKNPWIHEYSNGVKGSTGSYGYIVVSIVSGNLRYILLAIPIPKLSMEKDYYVKELLLFVQSLIPVEIVLLDRGFYTWGVIKVLQELRCGYIILVPKHAKFREWLKRGAGLYEHHGILNRGKTIEDVRTLIAVLPAYKGFDWVFATNIKYDDIIRYVQYYKKRWGIETTFRVHDEVKIKSKTTKPVIRYALFVFECLLYNLWRFFKGGLSFRRFINILNRIDIIKAVVFLTIDILLSWDILAYDNPPPNEIYGEVIKKLGYNAVISLYQGC